MARPREFDEDQAIAQAMNVFWEHGYEGASITRLLDGMNLTKGSLYKAFTDKRSLFLVAMARYEAEQVAPGIAMLRNSDEPDGRARIRAVFNTVPAAVRAGDNRGCLLCSAAAGPSFDDTEIAELVESLMSELRIAFQDAAAQFSSEAEAERIARVLLTQYIGLRILARAQVSADELERNVDATLAQLQ